MEMPAGLTPEMLKNIQDFLSAQPVKGGYVRPSGLLKQDQIRGVNPRYQYERREYPKALTPPLFTLENEKHERAMRVQWHTPLPWSPGEGDGKELIADYYASQTYPRDVTPPQVIVYSAEEEAAKMAAWRAEGGTAESSHVVYPKWLFNHEHGAKYVANQNEEIALGNGWFASPAEALAATAKPVRAEAKAPETQESDTERDFLIERAVAAGLTVDKRWGVARLRKELDTVEAARAAA